MRNVREFTKSLWEIMMVNEWMYVDGGWKDGRMEIEWWWKFDEKHLTKRIQKPSNRRSVKSVNMNGDFFSTTGVKVAAANLYKLVLENHRSKSSKTDYSGRTHMFFIWVILFQFPLSLGWDGFSRGDFLRLFGGRCRHRRGGGILF